MTSITHFSCFSRIAMSYAPTTGPVLVNVGPLLYPKSVSNYATKILNNDYCKISGDIVCTTWYSTPSDLAEVRFRAPKYSMYYFGFTAFIERKVNLNEDEWAKISVWKNCEFCPGNQATKEREFYKFVKNNSTGMLTASWHLYLDITEHVWVVNDRANTMFVGPLNPYVLRVYMYTPTDTARNEACTAGY